MTDIGQFMDAALEEAEKSLPDDVPVGAVIVKDGKIIARAHNVREKEHSPSGHAEIRALEEAARATGDWRLGGCDMFVTLEPCPMCAGAISQARISRVFFGAYDPEAGAAGSKMNILSGTAEVYPLIKDEAAAEMLNNFFDNARRNRRNAENN